MRRFCRWSIKRAAQLTAPPLAVLALGGMLELTGCKGSETSATPPTVGKVAPTTSAAVATPLRPLAAALSPDGKTIYMTALDMNGLGQIYSGPAAGPLSALSSSTKLSYPCGLAVTADGNSLLLADLGDAEGNGSSGAVYSGTTSGNLSVLTMGTPTYPTGVAFGMDGADPTAYITGTDSADGQQGVWKIKVAGGTAVQIYKGVPLSNPTGVAVGNDGSLYVADSSGMGTGLGAVFRISDGRALQINKTPLRMHFPVGITSAGTGFPDLIITTALTLGLPNEPWLIQLGPDGTQTPLMVPGVTVTEPTTVARAPSADLWVAVDGVTPAPDQSGMPGVPDPAVLDNPPGQIIQLTP